MTQRPSQVIRVWEGEYTWIQEECKKRKMSAAQLIQALKTDLEASEKTPDVMMFEELMSVIERYYPMGSGKDADLIEAFIWMVRLLIFEPSNAKIWYIYFGKMLKGIVERDNAGGIMFDYRAIEYAIAYLDMRMEHTRGNGDKVSHDVAHEFCSMHAGGAFRLKKDV